VKIKKRTFGVLASGQKASIFTISNCEMSFSVTNYGCIITSIIVPSPKGNKDDIVLGYSTLEGYTRNSVYFGCLVGRFANRIANAEFSLEGLKYRLNANDHGNCLHGGKNGYHKMIWKAEPFSNPREAGVVFTRTSKDGEQGFPGNVDFQVSYSLTAQNDIIIRYNGKTDAATPVNLTNHTYFNLRGHDSGSVLDHQVQLFCDRYVPVDDKAIPLGGTKEVAGTPFDFRNAKAIGKDIDKVPGGYDHNWEINRAGDGPHPVAGVFEPETRRALTVYSTQPGVQFYTGNFLNGEQGKNGELYGKHAGFCLETQHFPDSPNRKDYPDCILVPGEHYRHQTIWHFDFEQ
jgi:aldose 1-epimerase